MFSPQLQIILIGSVVALACSLLGTFLVLRKMSLMSDAISHSILLGIVLAFFVVENLASPLLLLGATLIGLLTVFLTEMLVRTRRLKEDASIGLVFPLLFSIAVILISKFASQVHLDMDAVLLGELAFAPFDRFIAWGIDFGPQSLWLMGVILLMNLLFIVLFYKELKISTFDPGLATALGFSSVLLHYALMALVSITAVGAFDAVGAILVVALMIVPPSAAYLLTRRLSLVLILSGVIGVLSAIFGYGLAYLLDASIAGCMATMTGIFFGLAFLFSPQRGLIAKARFHARRKIVFASHLLTVHLLNHEKSVRESVENTVGNIYKHLKWNERFSSKVLSYAVRVGLITRKREKLFLTSLGRETAKNVMVQ